MVTHLKKVVIVVCFLTLEPPLGAWATAAEGAAPAPSTLVTHTSMTCFVFGFSIIIRVLHVISILNVRTIGVIATVHIITIALLPTVTFLVLLRTCLRKVMGKPINYRIYLVQLKIGF